MKIQPVHTCTTTHMCDNTDTSSPLSKETEVALGEQPTLSVEVKQSTTANELLAAQDKASQAEMTAVSGSKSHNNEWSSKVRDGTGGGPAPSPQDAEEFKPSRGRAQEALEISRAAGKQARGKAFPKLLQEKPPLPMCEHVQRAINLTHPFAVPPPLKEEAVKAAIWAASEHPARVNDFRERAIKAWKDVATRDWIESQKMWDKADPRVKAVAGHLNVRFIKRMEQSCVDWKDMRLADDILKGSKFLGDTPNRHIWPLRRTKPEITVQQWHKSRRALNMRCIRSMKARPPSELDDALWEKTLEEIRRDFVGEPVPLEELDLNKVAFVPRFPVWQGKVRAIDNHKVNDVNKTYGTWERLLTHGVDHAAAMIGVVASHSHPEVRVKGMTCDQWSAYKQRAMCPAEQELFYILTYNNERKLVALPVKSMVFGSSAMVLDYNRLPELICRWSWQHLRIPVHHYFDDLWNFEGEHTADTAMAGILAVHEMTGVHLDPPKWKKGNPDEPPQKKAKIQYPTFLCVLLGVLFDLLKLQVTNTEDRITSLTEMIEGFRKAGKITPGEASKVRGKLGFASAQLYGRAAASHMKSLRTRQEQDDDEKLDISPSLDRCFRYFKNALRHETPREIPIHHALRPLAVIYSDAEGTGGLGFCCFNSSERIMHVAASKAPEDFCTWLGERMKNPIAPLEAYAAYAAVHHFQDRLEGMNIILFEDNTVVENALITGSSDCEVTNELAHQFWLLCTRKKLSVWIERVPSKSNLADIPSRQSLGAPPISENLPEGMPFINVACEVPPWKTLLGPLLTKQKQGCPPFKQ